MNDSQTNENEKENESEEAKSFDSVESVETTEFAKLENDDYDDLENDDSEDDVMSIIDTNPDGQGSDKNKTTMDLYDWMQCFVSAILCGIFIFVFIGRTIGVEGHSMLDTLHWNDRVIMLSLFYTPKNGDIIIFRAPTDYYGTTPLVKRVIATEGQTVDINFETGEVFVDGQVLDESSYINEITRSRMNFTGEVTVPPGHVFVMGDNRNNSADSRDARIGMVDTRYILGKVVFLLVPGQDQYTPRDWRRMGLIR
ncbi:MAG: signal peptidase I [Oscillospiraceae bacterium]|nr:signal peptidase I [Oscillospiraceae bacterium]